MSLRCGSMTSRCFSTPTRNRLRIGHIGLQSREGAVAFRNVRLKPMGLQPLFNGHDLDGWNKERAEKCQFQVTDKGELHLSNGPGQIETVRDYTNFVLQLECKVNGNGLNSGIFFRTLRKGRWAGYESQIQNSVQGWRSNEAEGFWDGGHLSAAAGAASGGGRYEVVYEDDRCGWAAYGGVGEWVSGERLDRQAAGEGEWARRVAAGRRRDCDSGA